jgi:hypothetical protein
MNNINQLYQGTANATGSTTCSRQCKGTPTVYQRGFPAKRSLQLPTIHFLTAPTKWSDFLLKKEMQSVTTNPTKAPNKCNSPKASTHSITVCKEEVQMLVTANATRA